MGVDRFYCPEVRIGQTARLEGDEARHLARVRRVAIGAAVEVFDGAGLAALATVLTIGRDQVEIRVEQRIESAPPAPIRLTLAVAIPKGDRFDWLVEKATELGVERLIPLQTERSTVDPRSAKLDRLRRAVIESCKQCRRDTLMVIDPPRTWDSWVQTPVASTTRRWLAHPGGESSWGPAAVPRGGRAIVAIGPEGGFTPQEVAQAARVGWEPVTLTPTILRIETAALAVAAHLLLDGSGP